MPSKRVPRHRVIRWAIQLVFLALFVYLFLRTRNGVSAALQDIFFRFDPLILIVTSLAARALVSAVLLSLAFVILTLVFGRFFCGFVCPLGTTIDLADAAIRRPSGPATRLRSTKYVLLLFLVLGAALGSSLLRFFDPLVILGRSLALVFYPSGTYLAGLFSVTRTASYTEGAISAAVLLTILGLGFVAPRFWCRNLCPLGALYALLAKFSLLKFAFTPECRSCAACEPFCPTGAIDSTRQRIDSGECIDCTACAYRCPDKAISYRTRFQPAPFDVTRREMILAVGTSLVLAPLAKNLLHARTSGRLIRPPGAIPEPEFIETCIGCGRCLKVCPTNGLQPCILESGFNGMWTPRLVPRIGGCEKNCNMCGQVCPTSAIRSLPLEDKSCARIGTAVIDRSRCIAWEQDKVCLVCDEACQYNAIDSMSETIHGVALLRPFIDERYCVGCGICESRCPVEGAAAVQVYSIGEIRKRKGSYQAEGRVLKRECGDLPKEDVPSGFTD